MGRRDGGKRWGKDMRERHGEREMEEREIRGELEDKD